MPVYQRPSYLAALSCSQPIYLSNPVDSTADTDVLRWWRDNEAQLPQTAVVARRYLSMLATLVESERLGDCMGLLPDNIEMLN